MGRTEGAGKNVLECKFVVFLKGAACLKLNCLCKASTGGGICPSVADIQGAPHIRGAKNLSLDLQKIVVTGANKRPVWLLLSGTSVYPHYLVITSSKHL